jgi:hypothetical protein
MSEKIPCVKQKVLLTNKFKITKTVFFHDGQVPWINGKPPKFIAYDCKLWQHTGMSVTAYFYREVESFVQIKLKPKQAKKNLG